MSSESGSCATASVTSRGSSIISILACPISIRHIWRPFRPTPIYQPLIRIPPSPHTFLPFPLLHHLIPRRSLPINRRVLSLRSPSYRAQQLKVSRCWRWCPYWDITMICDRSHGFPSYHSHHVFVLSPLLFFHLILRHRRLVPTYTHAWVCAFCLGNRSWRVFQTPFFCFARQHLSSPDVLESISAWTVIWATMEVSPQLPQS